MKYPQIRIGTCIPGHVDESWAPALMQHGFETM